MSAKTVFEEIHDSIPLYDIAGTTERKEATPQDGWMTSSVEKLLREAASFGITAESILLASVLIVVAGLVVSFMMGIKFDQSHIDIVNFGKQKFQMVGMGEVPGAKGVYVPVYKDSEVLLREVK